jgi:environmental stress-induced protein Ves
MTSRCLGLIAIVLGSISFSACGGGSPTTITPPPATYTIGGTVSGLSGTGLVLQDNGGDNLTVAAGATTFTFATKITSGGAYKVTVLTQPSSPVQTCAVTSGSGTATANVTTVQVACTTAYTIGGTVSGLSGTGLVLQDNSGDNLTVAAGATTFTFATAIAAGTAYSVTVSTQPSNPTQTCTVTSGSGTATANVTTVQVACTTVTYTIGGTVSGLSGTGLVLQDNGVDNLPVTANGTFTFATAIASGSAYKVTVLTQPSSPAQTCTVTGGSGTASANVITVQVACVTATFTIGGTVAGLSGAGLVLQDNGGDNLTIKANGAFTFATAVISGGAYSVTVLTQPSNPAQTCVVSGGTGAVGNANLTSVLVMCTNTTAAAWAWMNGSNIVNQMGVYGTLGVAAAGNVPGARDSAASWTDASGNFWLFGGRGYDSVGTSVGVLNDLWKYSAGQWTWVAGANIAGQTGTYGTLGVAAASNIPGARAGATYWTDATGNFWLFGGFDPSNGWFNDLWEYSAGQWTWVSGSNTTNQAGIYGTEGVAAAGNAPGSRWDAVSWTDSAGSFWIFGGSGYDSANSFGGLNDLWKYSAGQWAWVSGSNTNGQAGSYGTLGIAAAGNVPGGRILALGWSDATGNFWLFGGQEYDSVTTSANAALNDLWRYSAGEWTWMGGANVASQFGTYGTLGTAAAGNVPGGRIAAVGWTDAAKNFWLFGGAGYGAGGSGGRLNDLWRYSAGEWTWMGGTNLVNQAGTYGTLGTAAAGNLPGGRSGAVAWSDAGGNFWLLGGFGFDSTGTPLGELNDLWNYQQ